MATLPSFRDLPPMPGSIVVDDAKTRGDVPIEPRAPHPLLALSEGRAVFEFGAFFASRAYLSTLPKGDGHSVMTLPGFMATNSSTRPMRNLLKSLGYDAHGWDSGRNVRVNEELVSKLEDQIDHVECHRRTTATESRMISEGVDHRQLGPVGFSTEAD